MHRRLILSILGALAVLSPLAVFRSSASGPNLVQNGDFSQGTTQWSPYPGQELTTLLQPYFGAISVTQTVDTASPYGFSGIQCVGGISDLHEYTIAADILIPSGQERTGSAAAWAGTFASPDCTGPSTGLPSTDAVTSDAWTHQEKTFVPPDGTKSILVVLYGLMEPVAPGQDPTADFTVAFDNISLTQGYKVKNVTIEICKTVVDNGDQYLDSGVFTFAVAVQGQAPFVTNFPVAAGENDPVCATVHFDAYGVEVPPGSLLTVTENPLPGWTNQAGYPTFSANGGPTHVGTYAGLANLGGAWIDYANKRVPNEGNVPLPQRSITFCSQIGPNGDGDTESGTWIVSVFVQGNPVPVHQSFVNPHEGNPADCLPLNLSTLGVANETAFTVTQTLSPFTQAAGYPRHDIGAGFVSGNIANFNYPLGSGDNFLVKFANKEAVAAPPPVQTPSALEICKTVLDDGDGIVEGGDFTFDFGVVGQPASASVTFTAFEGETKCGNDDIVAAGYPANGAFYFTEVGQPSGWDDATGYPKHNTGNGLVTGGTATFTLNQQTLEAHISFVNKDDFDIQATPVPEPLETPTPRPSPPTPAPTSTPTPTPPSSPTSTPTPTSTGTPPASATPSSTATPAGQGSQATPASQEQQPPAGGDDVAGVSSTPLAPSTGNGSAGGTGGSPLAIMLGLLALAASAPFALLAVRRR